MNLINTTICSDRKTLLAGRVVAQGSERILAIEHTVYWHWLHTSGSSIGEQEVTLHTTADSSLDQPTGSYEQLCKYVTRMD
jgi:hypothetical protein